MKKHSEGGYFRETYRAATLLDFPGHKGKRTAYAAIYYLVAGDQISSFHRIKSDEIWHFYAGGSLALYTIKEGKMSKMVLGNARRQTSQSLVESGCWMAGSVNVGDFCLVGCTVSPGFDIRDWELGTRSQLASQYPDCKRITEKHTTV